MRVTLGFAVVTLAIAMAAGPSSATASGCPASAPLLQPRGGQAAGELVAPGAISVLLCSYHGLNPPATAHRLSGSRLLTARTQIAGIARQLDALPKPSRLVECPMDDGSEITATFAYANRASERVAFSLTGCTSVTNGRITRTAATGAGPGLLAQLEALVR